MSTKPRVRRMHMIADRHQPGQYPCCIVKYQCKRCRVITDWMKAGTVTEMKRGIPCERCNGKVKA